MKLLLDTHVFLWFLEGDTSLSAKARTLIESHENNVYVSVISLFEISIKLKLGKISLQQPLEAIFQYIITANIEILPISNLHLLHYQKIPLHSDHRDPFDRLIIATAVAENAELISVDSKFQYYPELITPIW